jgi:hypothetical protein
MFPELSPQLQNNTEELEAAKLGKSFLFDFNTGDFITKDGKLQVISDVEALKIRIEKVLKTEKFKFKIYDTDKTNKYGITVMDLITSGYPQAFIQSEIQREITAALLVNPEVLSLENFIFTREKRTLVVNFDVNSIYGTTGQEVKF